MHINKIEIKEDPNLYSQVAEKSKHYTYSYFLAVISCCTKCTILFSVRILIIRLESIVCKVLSWVVAANTHEI